MGFRGRGDSRGDLPGEEVVVHLLSVSSASGFSGRFVRRAD